MSESMIEIVKATMDAIPDVERWNANLGELKRLALLYGDECKKLIAAEAVSRGYLWSSTLRQYVHPWTMKACNHAGRLIGVGWRSGQLACIFARKDRESVRYESESREIPEETAQKLVHSPYPDALYKKLIIDKNVKMTKVI